MQVKIIRAAALCLAVILGIGIYLTGCTKKPSQPPPVEPKDYYVYFGDDAAPNTFYRYDTGTMELDSFYLPYNSLLDGIGISPDGKTMYLHPEDGIAEVSVDSLTIIAEHPMSLPKGPISASGHEVLISPDGRFLALVHYYLHLIDLSDYSIIYSDTSALYGNGWFSFDSKTFFCSVAGDSHFQGLEIKLDDSLEVIVHEFDEGSVSKIIASPDNKLRFLYISLGSGIYRFLAYDVEKDSVIFSKDMCPGYGDMEITHDGHYVIYSQPGRFGQYCVPPNTFTIYDVFGSRIDREVNTYFDSLQTISPIDLLIVTPDSRRLIGLGWNSGYLFDYNLMNHTYNRIVDFQGAVLRPVHSLTCQSKP